MFVGVVVRPVLDSTKTHFHHYPHLPLSPGVKRALRQELFLEELRVNCEQFSTGQIPAFCAFDRYVV
jgi:hypothetical protein